MTCVIPEYCFTPEEDADYYKRGKRCAEKGGEGCRTITICGREAWLPPKPFTDGRRRVDYLPGPLVFQVYTRRGLCIGASAHLEEAREWTRKRGRNAGHQLHVCVDYSA